MDNLHTQIVSDGEHLRRRLVVAPGVAIIDGQQVSMAERLLCAASRLKQEGAGAAINESTRSLRDEQVGVYEAFVEYLQDVATRPSLEERIWPMCRIIQPPRTGKTVIAGHIIGGTGLDAVFMVPTKTLVEQTVRELRAQLPNLPIGLYYGETKELVPHGVNVATYAIAQRDAQEGELQEFFRQAPLVFCDEAHQTMTPARLKMLREAFDPLALRIALTATPDYSDTRSLVRFFPDLVHEITLSEALDLDLLAPLRVWVAEVEEDGSSISLIAGDYEEETLGRIMSAAPFFRAVEVFRYSRSNRRIPALICCSTRQQATDLLNYLRIHRHPGAPEPALVLGNTPSEERTSVLERFERGELDTLINVGVLVHGWNSPRCKLLIDLAPSLSHVRAMQKFFRVMTKHGETEARIYIVQPTNLPSVPLYPMDFLGLSSTHGYECGSLVRSRRHLTPSENTIEDIASPIERVRLKHRVIIKTEITIPKLNPRDAEQVRTVIRSNPGFRLDRLIDIMDFRILEFRHELFSGSGSQLLRYLGAPTRESYDALMVRLFTEAAANRYLTMLRHSHPLMKNPWDLEQIRNNAWCRDDPAVVALRSFAPQEPVPTPEELVEEKQMHEAIRSLVMNDDVFLHRARRTVRVLQLLTAQRVRIAKFPSHLRPTAWDAVYHAIPSHVIPAKDQIEEPRSFTVMPFAQRTILWYYGFEPFQAREGKSDEDAVTLRDIGNLYQLSPERVRQILSRARLRIRKAICPDDQDNDLDLL